MSRRRRRVGPADAGGVRPVADAEYVLQGKIRWLPIHLPRRREAPGTISCGHWSTRLAEDVETERRTALEQIYRIAAFRLEDAIHA